MRGRSSRTDGVSPEPSGETSCANSKRPYNRKALICRLCLRVLPKEELPEIFTLTGSTIQKAIRLAVSVEVTRKDRSIRICHCCLDLVHLINDFRSVCEQTQLLLTQNVEISSGFWYEETDQKVFGKCKALVEHCRKDVDKLFLDQSLVYCDVKAHDLIDETADLVEEPTEEVKPNVTLEDGEASSELALLDTVKQELDNDKDSVKSKHESIDDFDGVDVNDPDYEEEEFLENIKQEDDHDDDELAPRTKRIKKEPGDPPKRRGRPALPEEMLKRRRRKPGEPRKKPGPKNRIKLPAQSVCEICGMLVNRENQERHRNEHLGHRPYACTVEGCTHAFSSKAGLHGHLARHADRNNVYDCDICGAKIKTKSSLHRHRKMHTTEKPHACTICGKRFWRKSYLNHHSTVHTGIAKFPCEYCGFVFKNKYWRSFHVKQKHVAKGEVPKFEAHEELEEDGEIPEGVVSEMDIEFS